MVVLWKQQLKVFFSYKGGLLFEEGNTLFSSHVLQMLHPY
jgi:hypothetical protein